MKIRLIGTPAELRAEVERLDSYYGRARVFPSQPFPARREPPGIFRVYVTVEPPGIVQVAAPEPVTVPATPDKTTKGLPGRGPGDLPD